MEINEEKIEPLNPKETYPLDSLYPKYESYCCPLCSTLPEILSYNKGKNTVKFNCKNHGENIMDISEYMEKMKNLESSSELKTKNKCTIHNNQEYSFYCQICKQNLCKDCFSDPIHETHIKYEINSLNPDKGEILIIKNEIEMLFQKRNDLLREIKLIGDNISFFVTLIETYEKQSPNYLLNINLKHLIYGETLKLDTLKNAEFVHQQSLKEKLDEFIQIKFVKVTEGLNKLNLVDEKSGDDLINELFQGIENNTFCKSLISAGQIKGEQDIIAFKNIKYLNLRGNYISSLNFLSNRDFGNLEMLSLNDNEINNIDVLKTISFPFLKELYLSKNQIENIDVLEHLKIPELKVLWLSNNKITSIEVLEKVNFRKLSKLNLSKNKISDISVFTKNRAKFPLLYELYLNDNQYELKDFDKIIGYLFTKVRQFYY